MPNYVRSDTGLTLVELLVAMTIIGIVLGITTTLFATTTRVFARETLAVELQGDLAGAKNVFLDDVSIAGYSPDGDVDDPSDVFPTVSLATNADSVSFIGDINSDGLSELICYRLNGANLERVIQDPGAACNWANARSLADAVESFNLTFLREDRSVATAAQVTGGEARAVQLSMVVAAPMHGMNISRTITGEVAVRNCMESDLCN